MLNLPTHTAMKCLSCSTPAEQFKVGVLPFLLSYVLFPGAPNGPYEKRSQFPTFRTPWTDCNAIQSQYFESRSESVVRTMNEDSPTPHRVRCLNESLLPALTIPMSSEVLTFRRLDYASPRIDLRPLRRSVDPSRSAKPYEYAPRRRLKAPNASQQQAPHSLP